MTTPTTQSAQTNPTPMETICRQPCDGLHSFYETMPCRPPLAPPLPALGWTAEHCDHI